MNRAVHFAGFSFGVRRDWCVNIFIRGRGINQMEPFKRVARALRSTERPDRFSRPIKHTFIYTERE